MPCHEKHRRVIHIAELELANHPGIPLGEIEMIERALRFLIRYRSATHYSLGPIDSHRLMQRHRKSDVADRTKSRVKQSSTAVLIEHQQRVWAQNQETPRLFILARA